MHQAMLDGHMHEFIGNAGGSQRESVVQLGSYARIVIVHFIGARPVSRQVGRQVARIRVYAE